jgi:hypothetical protein
MTAVEGVSGHRLERRFRRPAPLLERECRICWRSFTLEAKHVEYTDLYVCCRCPNCGCSFPIRRIDAQALEETSGA